MIDWIRVETLMLRSFRGEKMYDDELEMTRKAFEADPTRYKELNHRVRGDEIERTRSGKPK